MEELPKRKSIDVTKTLDEDNVVHDLVDVVPPSETVNIKLSEDKLKAINDSLKPRVTAQEKIESNEETFTAKPFAKVREDTVVTFIPKGHEMQTITSNGIEYDVVFANVDTDYTLEKLYMREFLEHLLERVFKDD